MWHLLDIFHRYESEGDGKSVESRRRKRYLSHLESNRLHPNWYKGVSPCKLRRLNRSSSLSVIRALSLSFAQALIWSVPVTLVVAFVIGAIGLLVGPYDTETTRWQEETRIVAMAGSVTTEVDGSFFIGTYF